ncbi:MAG TPA: TRAP transporter small permease [Spirochaetales bacterium]|nr:TRAP transporter small permease [Spirochaetales bacterium]HOV39681.1 TRAP transporter small permease [Spirochaetales bacterium]
MKRLIRILDERFEEVIGIIGLAITISLLFIGVVMRVVFNSGISWQEELSRMLYVLVVYLGASYGIKPDDHIRVTILLQALPEKIKKLLKTITDLIWIVFNIVIIILSIDTYGRMRQTLGETAILMIPLHSIFFIVPMGFILITLRLIQKLILSFKHVKEEVLP